AVADANVEHVAARDRAKPYGRLLAHMHVTDDLRAVGDESGFVNLRMNAAEWPDHETYLSMSSNSRVNALYEQMDFCDSKRLSPSSCEHRSTQLRFRLAAILGALRRSYCSRVTAPWLT